MAPPYIRPSSPLFLAATSFMMFVFPFLFVLRRHDQDDEDNEAPLHSAVVRFLTSICSRLWRGDFRYTQICLCVLSCYAFFCTSGEAILDTLKNFVRGLATIVCASGEAVLGTLKYVNASFLAITVSRLRRGDLGTQRYFPKHFD